MTTKISPFLALRIPNFRNYLLGSFVSEIGNQMQTVGVAWQVYELTRNPINLAFIGLANFGPILLFSLIGGLAADKLNRKKLLLVSQISLAFFALILFFLTIFHFINPWLIYLVLFLHSTASSFSLPARQAILPNLVPRNFFMNAVSLQSLQYQSATLAGPAIAGILIGGFGVHAVYLFNAASFIFFIAGILAVKIPPHASDEKAQFNLGSIHYGIKFVLSTPVLYSTMILDFLATFFGTATILLPVFAKEVLHVGPTQLGLLYSAPAIGAVIAGLLLSFMHRIKYQGRVILISVFLYGVATIGFGLSKIFWLSMFFMIFVGFFDMISSVVRNTIRQMITPDHLRGRMASITRIFFQGGPQLGDIEGGLLAAAVGGPITVVVGGVGTIMVTSILAYLSPKLRNYQGKEVAV